MPFTNEEYLRKALTPSRVDSFRVAYPGELDGLIAESDKIITQHSRIQPPGDAKDASPDVRRYAAWIVSFLMTDSGTGLKPDEYDQREAKFDRALKALDAMEGVAPGVDTAPVDVTVASTVRLDELL